MMIFEEALTMSGTPDIRILGIGGAGMYITQQVAQSDSPFKFYSIDSNKDCLNPNMKGDGVILGKGINPSGLGAGSDVDIGEKFALESKNDIQDIIMGADMLFLVAGLGGGIGSGCLPAIVKMADDMNIPIIVFVTEPFSFEGGRRNKNAKNAIRRIEQSSSAIIVLSHDDLLGYVGRDLPFVEAMGKSGEFLAGIIQRVLSLCAKVGLINIDFSDLRTLLSYGGYLFIGEGVSKGKEHLVEGAISQAAKNPLLSSSSIEGEKTSGILVYLEVGPDFNLGELSMIGDHLDSLALGEAEILLGVAVNAEWDDQVRVTIMALKKKSQEYLSVVTEDKENILEFTNNKLGY